MINLITIRAELKYPKWVKGPKGDPAFQLKIDEEGNLVAAKDTDTKDEEEQDNGEN